jgi:uncharacterized protein (DUF433 family)
MLEVARSSLEAVIAKIGMDMARTSQEYKYMTRLPKTRGGHPVIEKTRIGVHDVVGLLQNRESVDTVIKNCFPEITRAQVYECLAYYADHQGEIDLLLARQTAPPSS